MQKMEVKRTSSGLSVVVGCQSGNLTVEEADALAVLLKMEAAKLAPFSTVEFHYSNLGYVNTQTLRDGDVLKLGGRHPGLWFNRDDAAVPWGNGAIYSTNLKPLFFTNLKLV